MFSKRFILFGSILLVHIAVIFGPVGCYWLKKDEEKLKEIVFKVQLGGLEPSHAPEVGPPERLRPSPNPEPSNPTPPPPPEEPAEPAPEPSPPPVTPPPPKPEPPKPDPAETQKKLLAEKKRKAEAEKKRKIEAEKKRKADAEKKRKIEAEKKRKADAELKRINELKRNELKRKAAEKKRKEEAERKRKEAERNAVYRDPNADKFNPDSKYTPPGGKNFNRNVKIGNRDAGQKRGPVDGKTPAGGATKAEEEQWRRFSEELQNIIRDKWHRPAGIWISEETAAVIAIRVDKTGRVIGKKIVKASPNAAVNNSAKMLLNNLNKINQPPAGATDWLEIKLIAED